MTIHVQAHVVPHSFAAGPSGDYIRRLVELRRGDFALAGEKGAGLGELHNAHFPVPDGFVITTSAYLHAMKVAGVRGKLLERSVVTPGDLSALTRDAAALRDLVEKAGLPDELKSAIATAYRALGDTAHVIVRTSSSYEDRAGTLLADRREVSRDVSSEADLFAAVVSCWVSAWGERVIAYRAAQGTRSEPAVAVVVQHMVDTTKAGAVFSTDPARGDVARVVVEARPRAHGQTVEPLGDSGSALADQRASESYMVAKRDHRLVSFQSGADAHCVLSEHELFEIVSLGAGIERHYKAPQHVEWALSDGALFVLRARPLPVGAH